jgi:hypothetical protein
MKESDILHETANLSLRKTKNGLEICLEKNTCAICIGKPSQGIERAKLTIDKMEKNIRYIRAAY